jgi:hypothetical protein
MELGELLWAESHTLLSYEIVYFVVPRHVQLKNFILFYVRFITFNIRAFSKFNFKNSINCNERPNKPTNTNG